MSLLLKVIAPQVSTEVFSQYRPEREL